LFALVIVLGGVLPPWDFDVREYHLQAPKEWFQQGRIGFMPHNIYANMPLGAEMHALLAMTVMPGERGWWYGALAGKTVMACFSLLTALSLVSAGRRFLGSEFSGWIAALVYLAQPWIVHTSIQGLNEPAVANYAWLAVYACLLGRQITASGSPWNEAALAGLFAGSAVACKYPAVLFVVAPLGAWLLFETLRAQPRDFKPLLAFLLGILVTCGPWLAKNAVLTGNPTYPLLVSVFGGETRTPEKDAQWRKAHQVPINAKGERYSPAQLMRAVRSVLIDSEYLGPLLAPLLGGLLLAIAMRLKTAAAENASPFPAATLTLVGGMLLFHLAVWWLATHRIDRFWVPALPYAAFLAGAIGAVRGDSLWRWSVGGFVAAGLVLSWLFVASPAIGNSENRWFVALDALRTDAATRDGDPRRVSAAHAWLNEQAQPGEAVLLVGDAQPFDLELPAFYNTCFDDCLLVEWTTDRTAAETRKELLVRGIQYVLIDWGEIERYRAPGNYGFSAGMTRGLITELVKQRVLEPLQTFGAAELYRVRPPKRRAPAVSPQ
jgi:4-amino-4-deoxy-L-arabinose transferase-like glycosyltransferase